MGTIHCLDSNSVDSLRREFISLAADLDTAWDANGNISAATNALYAFRDHLDTVRSTGSAPCRALKRTFISLIDAVAAKWPTRQLAEAVRDVTDFAEELWLIVRATEHENAHAHFDEPAVA